MNTILKVIKKIGEVMITLILIAILLDICLQVLSRLLPGNSISWTIELGEILMVYLVWLGICVVSVGNGHIAIDLLYNKFPPKMKRTLHTVNAVVTIAYLVVLSWFTYSVLQQYIMFSKKTVLLSISMYWVRFPLFVGCILMAFVTVVKEIQYFRQNPSTESNKEIV